MKEKMKQVVALVEPSFYGVDFVKSAFNKGHKVVVITHSEKSPNKYGYEGYYHDLIMADIRDAQSIITAIQESPYNRKLHALIPATDFASHITAMVAESLGLRNVTYDAAVKARNKDLAKEAFINNYVPCARYQIIKSYEEALTAVQYIKYPAVIKPTNAASSQGVYLVKNEEELKSALKKLLLFKQSYLGFAVRDEYLLEEYLEGQEYSIELFLEEGNTLMSVVTEKTISPPPYFVETAHIMPAMIDKDAEKKIVNTAVQALHAIGLINGPSHVEVKMTTEGPKVIEVNGRPGGDQIASDLLMQAKGINVFDVTIDFYLNIPINLKATKNKGASVAFLTAEKEGRLERYTNTEILINHQGVVRTTLNVQSGEKVYTPKSSDDRLGYIITVGDTPESAKSIALSLINSIDIKYKTEFSFPFHSN
ncbi:ATP-grasp domain-containing protein [Oceanobacillus manasiensis]|uniref:ATP-grasp domain-containing protein n=1 Tax=Oceanobacillus manasiensis TaxID=586413 RepID=UPI000B16C9C0|nr:ATP-grasp domain-containing protein [Oceanobacillus manasiensis]